MGLSCLRSLFWCHSNTATIPLIITAARTRKGINVLDAPNYLLQLLVPLFACTATSFRQSSPHLHRVTSTDGRVLFEMFAFVLSYRLPGRSKGTYRHAYATWSIQLIYAHFKLENTTTMSPYHPNDLTRGFFRPSEPAAAAADRHRRPKAIACLTSISFEPQSKISPLGPQPIFPLILMYQPTSLHCYILILRFNISNNNGNTVTTTEFSLAHFSGSCYCYCCCRKR